MKEDSRHSSTGFLQFTWKCSYLSSLQLAIYVFVCLPLVQMYKRLLFVSNISNPVPVTRKHVKQTRQAEFTATCIEYHNQITSGPFSETGESEIIFGRFCEITWRFFLIVTNYTVDQYLIIIRYAGCYTCQGQSM